MFLKPVRKIRQSNRSITGKSPSLKTNSSQHFESTLERDLITLLEFEDEVELYQVQPVTIYYDNTRYTPDVAVYFKEELKRSPVLYEVKYAAELMEKQEQLKPKFDAANDYAISNGYEFKVITEIEIRTDRLFNAKFLSRYKKSAPNLLLASEIMASLKTSAATIQELVSQTAVTQQAKLVYTIWELLAQKKISADLDTKLTLLSPVWINSRNL